VHVKHTGRIKGLMLMMS